MRTRYLTLLPLFVVLGCGSNESNGPTHIESTGVSTARLTTAAVASKFSFALNGAVTEKTTNSSKIHKTPTESLVEFTGTGAVMGWSSPDAPQANVGWPASPTDHDNMARTYFVQRGVNSGELGKTTHFSGYTKGAPTSDPDAAVETGLGYSTSFRRSYAGFDVVDSRASVQLNSSGQPVSVHLFWPDIPSSVLSQAQTLQGSLTAGWSPKAEAIGAGWQIVRTYVTIHHGLAGDASLNWQATIRVELSSDSEASYVDCDAAGNLVHVYGGLTPSPQRVPNVP